MEENNNSNPVPAVQPVPAAKPAPEVRTSQTGLGLKVIAGVSALSLIAALAIIYKVDAAKKSKTNGMHLSKFANLVQSKKDAVAVIPLYGVISQGNSSRSWENGSQQIAKRIKTLSEKKEVKAILLDINTPG